MAITQNSEVGITSSPDNRLPTDSSTIVTPANWADPNRNDVTISISGRKVGVYPRSSNIYAPAGRS